ncbi:Xylose operon regulatory protein [Pseudobythopirellula maris]|uniref:Xylose operon regulatory protein n=1 Tax=Pseudobythopirellula maris TaxID=2527991 RepID=A0A5C5ZUH6_9BACT|nr:AraC family transcriptional regulator [Pseudobythopirellula maris]TWT91059.1 Xylose operon regulatory protein [Pseudobythopirellula maris]
MDTQHIGDTFASTEGQTRNAFWGGNAQGAPWRSGLSNKADWGNRSRHSSANQPLADETAGRDVVQYLPMTDTAVRCGVYLTGVGRTTSQPGEDYPPHQHPTLYHFDWRRGRTLPEYQVLLLTGAEGEYDSEKTGLVRFEGNVLLFVFPGVWHRYRPLPGTGWTERWLSLNGELVHRLIDSNAIELESPVVQLAEASGLIADLDELIDGVASSPDGASTFVGARAMGLLGDAVRLALTTGAESEDAVPASQRVEDPIVSRALEIIWNHSHSPPLGVGEIAKQLPVTRRTLDRRFSEALGHSVLDEINACRLSRAKRLLTETDLPVKTVSYLAGFPSRERMRVMFLGREGLTPSKYRGKCRTSKATA